MRVRDFLSVGVTLLFACTHDSSPCVVSISAVPIVATVVDSVTGANVCDAIATATVNGERVSLNRGAGDGSCLYSVPTNSPGDYILTVTAPGYKDSTATAIHVPGNGCGTVDNTQYVTIRLQPT